MCLLAISRPANDALSQARCTANQWCSNVYPAQRSETEANKVCSAAPRHVDLSRLACLIGYFAAPITSSSVRCAANIYRRIPSHHRQRVTGRAGWRGERVT